MTSPLAHINQFGDRNVEPTVTTFTHVETEETIRIDPVNDLILVSPFRDGKPQELRRFRDTSLLEALHDPSSSGDQGVKLAQKAKDGFADRNIFGAPTIVTLRPNQATPATATLDDGGGTDLLKVTRNSYGSHANGPGLTLGAGSIEGKKVTITSTFGAPILGDNLGLLFEMQYTGNATTATLSILNAIGIIDYTQQPGDGETVTVTTLGASYVFEFDNDDTVTGNNIAVPIGTDQDASWAAMAAAIGANASLSAIHDTANDRITINAADEGVVLAQATVGVTITLRPPAARLVVTLAGDQTDGSEDIDIPLTEASLQSIDRLVAHINEKLGYTATIRPTASKFLLSTGLDPLASANVLAAPVTVAGFVAAIADFINTRTRGRYSAEELGPRAIPNEATYSFAGGTTPPVTITDWDAALDVISAGQPGGILLLDTHDTAVFALVTTWIEEQRSAGRWFRMFAGAQPGLPDATYDQIAASIDNERVRIAWQRPGVFGPGNTIEYLHPVFVAAAMAGGAAGNAPYDNPLTDKRLRGFIDIHEKDQRSKTGREAFLEAGLLTLKREQEATLVALAVTTSRDPVKRMPRIMSEIDTVDGIDSAVRDQFQSFKGRWTDAELTAKARASLSGVLQEFHDRGAIVAGIVDGVVIPAFKILSVTVNAGVLKATYQIHIGGELNHIDITGFANYARIEEREVEVQLAA